MDKVLVVDSDPAFQKSLKESAANLHQFEVVAALDGQQALKVLSDETISVLVTDINADKVDGLQLLAHLSQNHRGMPCIVMSSYGRPWFYKPLQQKEILYHIEKPVSLVSLVSAILVGLSLKDESGIKQGISLSSFLPLLELERKTCRLEVRDGAKKGYLYFEEGTLIDAHYRDYSPESATAHMVTWENISLVIGELPRRRYQKRVNVPLMEIVGATWERKINGKKEKDSEEEKKTAEEKPSESSSISAAEQLAEKILGSQIKKFRNVQGYLSLAVFDEHLNLLAKDHRQTDKDLTGLLQDFQPALKLCSEITEKHGFSKCRMFTFHTSDHIIQVLYSARQNLPPFHLLGITQNGGNWLFVKYELENLENQLVMALKKPIIIK